MDVTFETLNRDDFLYSVKAAFPNVIWDKAYGEFRVAGESTGAGKLVRSGNGANVMACS